MPRFLAILILLSACFGPAAAWADEARAKADSIAAQLESPFCPGRTLDACTSPAAAEWREDIHAWVAEGVPPAEIRRRLEERAGRSLSATSTPGMAYGTLLLTSVASLGLLGFAYKKLLGSKTDELDEELEPRAEGDDEEQGELDDKLDRELKLMD